MENHPFFFSKHELLTKIAIYQPSLISLLSKLCAVILSVKVGGTISGH